MDPYMERALDQRVADFKVVRAWVFDQIDNNLPQFSHDLACMLCAVPGFVPPDYDWRQAAAADVDAMRSRMGDAVAAQPETAALADWLRERDAEDAREAEEEAQAEARYADACDRSIPNPHCW